MVGGMLAGADSIDDSDLVAARLPTGLSVRVPGLLATAGSTQAMAYVDVDDTIGEVHGYAGQVPARSGAGCPYRWSAIPEQWSRATTTKSPSS